MENQTSSFSPSCFLFENTDESTYPSDLILNIIDESSTSSSLTNTNGNLSPSSSIQLLDTSNHSLSYPCCLFYCKPNSHPFEERSIPLNKQVKIGRAVARLKALPNNAIFDCKVLSRQHAKIWYENGKFLLQDTKSSNGTFVNSQRLGKCNEESSPFEIYSDDIIQFGVDVTENNRKTIHNCIIAEVKLFHSDGNECLTRNINDQSQMKEIDINTQTLYQLAQYVQEAVYREQSLEQKLEYLQGVLRDAQQTSNDSLQAIVNEDRLLGRINHLEDQIRIYRTTNLNDETIKQELIQLTQTNMKFEEVSKMKLEKVLIERADALSCSKSFQSALELIQIELKHYEELHEQHKQDTEQLVQSVDEQRSSISEFEIKLRESEKRCTELENEKQRMQTIYDEYYKRTHPLEELQEKLFKTDMNHDQCEVESCSKNMLNNSIEIPIVIENGNNDTYNHIMDPLNQKDSIVNCNYKEEYDKTNRLDSTNELAEAEKQIALLRDNFNDTMERLVTTEDSFRSEQERYRLLTSEYKLINDELVQLKIRCNKEKNDNNEIQQEQKTKLEHLSKSILSKQNKHNQLLRFYICFFLFCYLLIFFLFFFLLAW